jgi:hypothetical protein
MKILRHEAGHAIDNGYKLRQRRRRQQIFGPSYMHYPDYYTPKPYSKSFVLHLDSWYAQSHPDEDFAETFAVWLTPGSRWRQQYKGWPAMQKLRYVDRLAAVLGDVEPIVKTGEVDITPDDISVTVGQFYQQAAEERQARIDIALDAHLGQIFLSRRHKTSRPATDIISAHQPELIDKITYWTGVQRPIVRGLIESICRTCQRMKLWGDPADEPRYLVEVTVLATTLAMNFLTRGSFEQH